MKVILASQSPRRRELLTSMGVDFEAIPSNFDERLDDTRTPAEVAIELAIGKANEVAERYPDCVVIGSDTIVTTYDGRQLEKPRDKDEAYDLLGLLSGTYNLVTTSVAVIYKPKGIQLVGEDTAKVFFKPYEPDAVATYVESGDPMDKAGAYGIQSGAAPLISHIEGHYDTVIGLPTHLLTELLSKVGVPAHPAEPTSIVPQTL